MQRGLLIAAIAALAASVCVVPAAAAGQISSSKQESLKRQSAWPEYRWVSNGFRARYVAEAPVILMLGIGY